MGQTKKDRVRLRGLGVDGDFCAVADSLGVHFHDAKNPGRGLLVFWGDLRSLMLRDPGPQDVVPFDDLIRQVRVKC